MVIAWLNLLDNTWLYHREWLLWHCRMSLLDIVDTWCWLCCCMK